MFERSALAIVRLAVLAMVAGVFWWAIAKLLMNAATNPIVQAVTR